LRTLKALDRESVAKYELVVQAVDRGTPELTGVASVTVIVEDVNDSPPQFDGTTVDGRVRLFITENSPVGAKVRNKKTIFIGQISIIAASQKMDNFR